ncbi:hypothetical protein [uncultured Planktosalinus sp.]|uniref:hypothetical protein n=1 Tax=uncultured Planktosalinus sp. TaxID=1810935 RepID=UPI0030DDA4C4
MKNSKRICIYPKDIQRITGKSERHARNLLSKIREYLNKEPHQFVTTEEFASFTGIKKEVVEEFIID